ncbi:hypothetical protein EDEG_01084 [Edhazardia aedis USNM 41457]|uniref:Uncharacterized protein n=1 Tax=Edhazardia aedis (strain USNM 41457) TaxID=1003232 RepID=J9DAF7_EDHAE|nr:hypothetical protein EDEG_01084 [Edhazardia aedis USNM 41457]|eukprot:EJW04721.1 hypothetical protein EDEG_01084 [Edhazardia aedis USNM 41457]
MITIDLDEKINTETPLWFIIEQKLIKIYDDIRLVDAIKSQMNDKKPPVILTLVTVHYLNNFKKLLFGRMIKFKSKIDLLSKNSIENGLKDCRIIKCIQYMIDDGFLMFFCMFLIVKKVLYDECESQLIFCTAWGLDLNSVRMLEMLIIQVMDYKFNITLKTVKESIYDIYGNGKVKIKKKSNNFHKRIIPKRFLCAFDKMFSNIPCYKF